MTAPSPYEAEIFEHARSPRHWGRLAEPTHHAVGDNPACGDTIEVWVKAAKGHVAEVGFEGEACTIARAGASLLLGTLPGKPLAEIPRLDAGSVLDLFGLKLTTSRVKCATLALHALKDAVAPKATAP